jgi:hypothetical protein
MYWIGPRIYQTILILEGQRMWSPRLWQASRCLSHVRSHTQQNGLVAGHRRQWQLRQSTAVVCVQTPVVHQNVQQLGPTHKNLWRVMAQADGRRPLTVEAKFNSRPVHVQSVVDKVALSFLL